MPITSDNFYHVQPVEPGIDVLFYIEFEGDNTILHQMTVCEIGSADIKVTMPADMLDNNWPQNINFEEAATTVVKSVRGMGFKFREAT